MPMLSGSAGSERSHVSSMSGSACFSACLRSFSASRSSSRVLNLSVSAFFVLMGFGGSCRARTKRLIEVGAMAESAAGFEGGDERAKERIARLVQLGSLVEAMCSTDVMDNYTSREDLKTTVTKALEHNVRTSDGMNWNLHDLVYEALSEEWGRRDGEISDLWADDGPSGYQPPSYEPVNPERRTPQTPSDGLI